jgi:hypothetical protein
MTPTKALRMQFAQGHAVIEMMEQQKRRNK